MDLKKAIEKHVAWKMKFRAAIDGHQSMDQVSIAKDNVCELGAWLHGPARAECSHCPSFHALIDAHREFHAEAGRIAAAINAKRFAEAEGLLSATAYGAASQRAIMAMMSVQREKAAKAA